MRIYIDVDGTLTEKQTGRSFFRDNIKKRLDIIDKVKEFSIEGHEIFIWSGSTEYAFKVSEELRKMGVKIQGSMGKPHLMVDNEKRGWTRKLKNRMILPEDFLQMDSKKD